MRIVCQKCAAAYAIDDRLISPKGVRAQCPRCRHLQLVKRDAVGPPPEAVAPAASAPQPQSAPPGPSPRPMPAAHPAAGNSALAADLFSEFSSSPEEALPPDPLFDGLVDPPPPRAAAAPPHGSSGDPLLDFLGPPPEAPPPPVMQAPRRAPGPAGAAPGGPGMPPQAARPQAPAPAPSAPVEAPVGCRECNKALSDPFDQAIGTCEDCRRKLDQPSVPTQATPAGASSSASASGFELPPLEAIDVSGISSEAPALTLEPRSGVRSNPPRPYSSGVSGPQPPQPLQMRSAGGGFLKALLVVLLLLLVGGGAGYYFLVIKPQEEAAAQLDVPPVPPPLPAAIKDVL
ncbi:zinc-ribbon domain-containing protein, partial [Hyalangium sp.]|uniref:zinc-ribbon domain-containing protein n=1 Tax=Hyalangium sp. TaxID=2028555 RepID=UPI002D65968B